MQEGFLDWNASPTESDRAFGRIRIEVRAGRRGDGEIIASSSYDPDMALSRPNALRLVSEAAAAAGYEIVASTRAAG